MASGTVPFNRNLIKNPCGEDGFNNWIKLDGGHGWAIENHHSELPEAPSEKCFVSSFGWCVKKQTVNLLKEGLSREFLDSQQPDICICDWYSCRHDCGCVYSITVCLLAEDKKTVIAKFEKEPDPIPQWSEPAYNKVFCVFRDYGPGVRYVSYLHKGKDTQFWAGHYGARITNSTVTVHENRLDNLEGAEIVTKGSEASVSEEIYDDDDEDLQVNMDGEMSSICDDSDDEFYDGNYREDPVRMEVRNWCTCNHCTSVGDPANLYCCREVHKIVKLMEAESPAPNCVTDHPGFEAVCLNQWVLHTASYSTQSKELDLENLLLHERYRSLSHQQFAQWCNMRERYPLPSCVLLKIQSALHSEETYHEFPFH